MSLYRRRQGDNTCSQCVGKRWLKEMVAGTHWENDFNELPLSVFILCCVYHYGGQSLPVVSPTYFMFLHTIKYTHKVLESFGISVWPLSAETGVWRAVGEGRPGSLTCCARGTAADLSGHMWCDTFCRQMAIVSMMSEVPCVQVSSPTDQPPGSGVAQDHLSGA